MSEPKKMTAVTNCNRCHLQMTTEDRVVVFGVAFHVNCLNCDECNVNIINGFHHNFGRFYCGKCVLPLVPNCANCKKVIGLEGSVKAADLEWHADCCVCETCKKPFEGGRYFPYGGRPYCLQDYWNRRVEKEQQQQADEASAAMTANAIELVNRLKKSTKKERKSKSPSKKRSKNMSL